METRDVVEHLRASAGHNGIIDYVVGYEHTGILRLVEGEHRLEILSVYDNFDEDGEPIEPDEDPTEDTYMTDSANLDYPDDVAALLTIWWNLRGRMTFAVENSGLYEDPYGRHPLIRLWGELT